MSIVTENFSTEDIEKEIAENDKKILALQKKKQQQIRMETLESSLKDKKKADQTKVEKKAVANDIVSMIRKNRLIYSVIIFGYFICMAGAIYHYMIAAVAGVLIMCGISVVIALDRKRENELIKKYGLPESKIFR